MVSEVVAELVPLKVVAVPVLLPSDPRVDREIVLVSIEYQVILVDALTTPLFVLLLDLDFDRVLVRVLRPTNKVLYAAEVVCRVTPVLDEHVLNFTGATSISTLADPD